MGYIGRVCMEIETIAKKKTIKKTPVIGVETKHFRNDEEGLTRIAVAAYYKAEARGYQPGYEIQDWLEAEAEVLHS